nr:MAG TPA: hypothetical protein [Caudoviricetes sp.]
MMHSRKYTLRRIAPFFLTCSSVSFSKIRATCSFISISLPSLPIWCQIRHFIFGISMLQYIYYQLHIDRRFSYAPLAQADSRRSPCFPHHRRSQRLHPGPE